MAKNKNPLNIILIGLALIIGFGIGIIIDIPKADEEDLSGAIGKVDRYRNVKVTDDDILLRNELLQDAERLELYKKYYTYSYYRSLRTSKDVELVLAKTTAIPEFHDTYYPYADALNQYKTYLASARTDILAALSLLNDLKDDQEIPIIEYINQAQNAIARIKSHDALLLDYLGAISRFIEENPDNEYQELEDAHDLISLNALENAIYTKDKPVMSFLEKKKLQNDKEGLERLSSEINMDSYIASQVISDTEVLQSISSIISDQAGVINSQALSDFTVLSTEQLGIVADSETIGDIINDTEVIGSILSPGQLNSIDVLSSQEIIGVVVGI